MKLDLLYHALVGPKRVIAYPTPWRLAEESNNGRVVVCADRNYVFTAASDEIAEWIVAKVNAMFEADELPEADRQTDDPPKQSAPSSTIELLNPRDASLVATAAKIAAQGSVQFSKYIGGLANPTYDRVKPYLEKLQDIAIAADTMQDAAE
jgi:hypothetical protein